MRKWMCVPMMTLCLLLAGCGGAGGEAGPDAASLRRPYADMAGCEMTAEVAWSDGEQLWQAEVLCTYVPGGETTVEVLSPETIAGSGQSSPGRSCLWNMRTCAWGPGRSAPRR